MRARAPQSSSSSSRFVGLSVVGAILLGALGLAFYAGAPRAKNAASEASAPVAVDPFAGLPPEVPPPGYGAPHSDPFAQMDEERPEQRAPLNARAESEFDAAAFEASLQGLTPDALLALASEQADIGAQLARDALRLQQVSDLPGMHAAGRAALHAYQRANTAAAHALDRLESESAPEASLADVRRRKASYVREIAGLRKMVPR